MKIFIIVFLSLFLTGDIAAQDNLYTRYTTTASRALLQQNLVFSINKNLARPLNDSTEDKWQEAFWALELMLYKSRWVNSRIDLAFDSIAFRSTGFQRALLELAYTNYPASYYLPVLALLQRTDDSKVFAMCAEYMLRQKQDSAFLDSLEETLIKKFAFRPGDPLIEPLNDHIFALRYPGQNLIQLKLFTAFLHKKFLPGHIIMFSLQRKNRDYPGLVLIRDKEGNFVRDTGNLVFSVPQLARSMSSLPGYLTNGNTPEGIFKMHGFAVSLSNFIGPSPNVQLSLPAEMSPKQFFGDSALQDTVWSRELYSTLLPATFRDYLPLYHTYYAGLAGRTEIIAHGTTIEPEYYKSEIYYPHTPSLGCLCTKEIWNGKRLESNQAKLINALLKAGGPNGYCVVIEVDDKQEPVTLEEILPYLSKAESLK